MKNGQEKSAGLYAQCIGVWLIGGVVYLLAHQIATLIIPVISGRPMDLNRMGLYLGVFTLLGVVFNFAWFTISRFSNLSVKFHFLGLNASVFIALTLCISIFFMMSRSFYNNHLLMVKPQIVYPFVALVIILTATVLGLSWLYYKLEFAVKTTTGGFWLSFLILTASLFCCLALLIAFNKNTEADKVTSYSFSVNAALGLAWIPLHAGLLRLFNLVFSPGKTK